MSLDVADKPGVLATVAQEFAAARREHLHRPPGRARRRRHAGDRHPQRPGRGAVCHHRRAAGHARRPGRDQRAARGGTVSERSLDGGVAGLAGADRGLPRRGCRSARRDAGRDAAGGRHPAAARAGAVPPHRLRGLPQGRGRQPDRFVQGPRHDDGDQQGRRGGREGGHLRLDRQHQRQRRRLRRPRRAHLRRPRARRARSPWASSPRRWCTARSCCRSRATSTTASRWPASWRSTTR